MRDKEEKGKEKGKGDEKILEGEQARLPRRLGNH
jgi:hypothetical protein